MENTNRTPSQTAGPTLKINITHPSEHDWNAVPGSPEAGAVVQNEGQVIFHGVPESGCRVYTHPADAFVNEVSGYEDVSPKHNSFKLTSAANNRIITYYVCSPGVDCRVNPSHTGPYAIQSGSQSSGDR